MSDEDYLWDKSSEPPADVAYLEHILEPLQWSGRKPHLHRARAGTWWLAKRPWLIAAAALVLLGLLLQRERTPVTSWQLSLAGQNPSSVRSGQVIETGQTSATMESESIGEVEIDPHSRLRLLATKRDRHSLALDHGTIHAYIWAPPTKFVVDTPAANAVDLGCQYTLSVANDGKGFLSVELGWVAFQWKTIESFIQPAPLAWVTGRIPRISWTRLRP